MKVSLHPAAVLAPVPAVIVTCGDKQESNAITLAWVGTVNSEPPIVTISVRYSRHSLALIARTGEFTINLISKNLVRQLDGCGVLSGRDCDKFEATALARADGMKVQSPYLPESPVSLECKVINRVDLPTHAVFFGEVVNVIADEAYVDRGRLALPEGLLVAYENGKYLETGETLGSYGFTAKEWRR